MVWISHGLDDCPLTSPFTSPLSVAREQPLAGPLSLTGAVDLSVVLSSMDLKMLWRRGKREWHYSSDTPESVRPSHETPILKESAQGGGE